MRLTASEEIALELHTTKGLSVPVHETTGYAAELLWNSTAYDRMQEGLKEFAQNPDCMGPFLYHQLLGHAPEGALPRPPRQLQLQAPGMPAPNHSQARLPAFCAICRSCRHGCSCNLQVGSHEVMDHAKICVCVLQHLIDV